MCAFLRGRSMYALLLACTLLAWTTNALAVHPLMTRTITFKNRCSVPVWIALTPGAIPGNSPSCQGDKDCLRGASCKSNQCVYPISLPQGKGHETPWELAAYNPDDPLNPATESTMEVRLQYASLAPRQPDDWGYNYVATISGRTGCTPVIKDGEMLQWVCETGQCLADEDGGCTAPIDSPHTAIEIILNQANADVYRLSFAQGINLPIGISPDEQPATVEPPSGQSSLFWCGHSGFQDARSQLSRALLESQNLLGCDWRFEPPAVPQFQGYSSTVFYTVVTYTGAVECTSDAECVDNERCGLSRFDLAQNQQAVPRCGKPIAFTVPATICKTPFNQGAILPKQAFGCYSQPGAMDAFKMQAYALCALPPNAPDGLIAPPSCYVDSASEPSPDCCGCIAWEVRLPLDKVAKCLVGDSVNGTANFWQTYLRDKVSWLAARCLAGEVYQFDEVHSTFKCSSENEPTRIKPNQLNYTVTYCPDGQALFENSDQANLLPF